VIARPGYRTRPVPSSSTRSPGEAADATSVRVTMNQFGGEQLKPVQMRESRCFTTKGSAPGELAFFDHHCGQTWHARTRHQLR
jgi:hypothetical protein